MAEGPKQFDPNLGQKTAEFIDSMTGMKRSQGDEISASWDPMDLIPIERAFALAGNAGRMAYQALIKKGVAPNEAARQVAEAYAAQRGLKIAHADKLPEIDPKRASKIAQEYENLKHAPNDPAVKRSYDALIKETADQFNHLKQNGLKVSKIKPGMENPYKTSADLHNDIRENNHMWYYPTEQGFGSKAGSGDAHPLLSPTQETIDGEPMLANDMFRVVHDYFGHAKDATSFGPRGEEAAWRAHMQMFSPEAQKALTTETRGQNSWVNFGPKGEANRANPSATVYADQKAALMPDWVSQPDGTPPNKRLVHYSQVDQPLSEIDPAYMGSGRQGLESRRGDIVPRSYYYEEGTLPETVVAQSAKNIHYVNRPEKIIDLNSPEAMPFREAAQDMNDLERRLQAAGFEGYSNSHPDNQVKNAVAVFNKQPVLEVKPVEQGHRAGKVAAGVGAAIGAGSMNNEAEASETYGPAFAQGGQVSDQMVGQLPTLGAPVPTLDPIDAFLAGPQQPLSADNVPPPGLDEFIAPEILQAQYGGMGQQAIAGLEGLAQGVSGPLATAFETNVLGVKPEDIRGREEANPGTHIASEVAGFIAPALATAGLSAAGKGAGALAKAAEFTQAGLLNKAAQAIDAAAGQVISNQLAKDVVREAFLAGIYQGGEEVSKAFKEDPDQTAESAIANIGLATAMGGVFGGPVAAALRKVSQPVAPSAIPDSPLISQADAPKMQEGDLQTLVKYDPGFTSSERAAILSNPRKWLAQEKPNANAIRSVGKEYNLPVLEGMVSGNQIIQRAEDALLNSGNTPTGVARQQLYDRAYKGSEHILNEALGEGSNLSKAQVGEALATSLKAQIKSENEPISAMYSALKAKTDVIPVEDLAIPAVKAEMLKIPEFRVTPNSPQGQLGKRIMRDLDNVKTVDDLKILKSSIHDSLSPMASAGERRMAAILADKLKKIEEDSIVQYALRTATTPEELLAAQALPAARREADAAYKPFIEKVQQLAKQLGKSRVHGAQDAINFIDNLDYEQVATRLFNKNKSQFIDFFAKEFPAEMEMLKGYQKGILREKAMKDGVFSPLTFFQHFNKLEPEIQRSLFNKTELKRIGDMETYLRSFPRRFNPSGAAHTINFREGFADPRNVLSAAAQDFAIERFVKMASARPDVSNALELAKATVEGNKLADRAIKAVLSGGKNLPAAVIPLATHRDKLTKLISTYQASPEKALAINDNNPVPEYQTAFAATAARAVQYLAANKPNQEPKAPLDPVLPLSQTQKDEYEEMVNIAQQPLSVLGKIAEGRLTPKDVQTLQAIYPSMYRTLSQRLIAGVMAKKDKGEEIDYQTSLQLSIFLAQPLDSTMTPMGIMSAQQRAPGNQPGNATMPKSGAKHSMSGLDNMAKRYQTQMQARQSSKLGK
jgi:hypothetical protein